MIEIVHFKSMEHAGVIRELFLEYAESLDFNLCFQNFDIELSSLPGEYSPPDGRLLLAYYKGNPAGCIALRNLDNGICEMKRLYVRPHFRGLKIGRLLTNEILSEAKKAGYHTIRLDTVPAMKDAQRMYELYGFYDIEPYRKNPVSGARYMELKLNQ
ncbi:MAG: GNAT family N-acetyltransferase [Flavobacterium sp.]|nr:GNAT family N-acetyltransferase [Flavobacterium sp.]